MNRTPGLLMALESAKADLDLLKTALLPLAQIPVEDFGKENSLDHPLMGWNSHTIYVRDVLRARAALKKAGAA